MAILTVAPRDTVGAKPAQLRRKGIVPMALIKRTHEVVSLQAPAVNVRAALSRLDSHGRLAVQVEGDSGSIWAIVKEADVNALRQELTHITLQEVSADDQVKVEVAITAINVPEADAATTLTTGAVNIKVKGKMGLIPDHIDVDLSKLQPGEHIQAGQLELPEGVELISSPETTLFTIAFNRTASGDSTVPTEPEPEESAT